MDDDQEQKISVSVPLGAIASAVVLGVVAAAYVIMTREEDGNSDVGAKSRSSSFGRKIGLRTLITLIENDATRKVLVAALKALARRS